MASLAFNREAITPRQLKPALLELDGISREAVEAHYKLYEGYVNKRNEILEKLAEVDLQRAHLRVDLVGRGQVHIGELGEDLVALVDVPLVELVVRLDRLARDAVQLEQRGLQLPRRDLLPVERERGQAGSFRAWGRLSITAPAAPAMPLRGRAGSAGTARPVSLNGS